FFQAEDGIRDFHVTGVQTCALPILAVYMATLKPGDTILGMNLAHGGHLTHGHPLNFSGKYFNIVPYGVRQGDERIDYDEVERLRSEERRVGKEGRAGLAQYHETKKQ